MSCSWAYIQTILYSLLLLHSNHLQMRISHWPASAQVSVILEKQNKKKSSLTHDFLNSVTHRKRSLYTCFSFLFCCVMNGYLMSRKILDQLEAKSQKH